MQSLRHQAAINAQSHRHGGGNLDNVAVRDLQPSIDAYTEMAQKKHYDNEGGGDHHQKVQLQSFPQSDDDSRKESIDNHRTVDVSRAYNKAKIVALL